MLKTPIRRCEQSSPKSARISVYQRSIRLILYPCLSKKRSPRPELQRAGLAQTGKQVPPPGVALAGDERQGQPQSVGDSLAALEQAGGELLRGRQDGEGLQHVVGDQGGHVRQP